MYITIPLAAVRAVLPAASYDPNITYPIDETVLPCTAPVASSNTTIESFEISEPENAEAVTVFSIHALPRTTNSSVPLYVEVCNLSARTTILPEEPIVVLAKPLIPKVKNDICPGTNPVETGIAPSTEQEIPDDIA